MTTQKKRGKEKKKVSGRYDPAVFDSQNVDIGQDFFSLRFKRWYDRRFSSNRSPQWMALSGGYVSVVQKI